VTSSASHLLFGVTSLVTLRGRLFLESTILHRKVARQNDCRGNESASACNRTVGGVARTWIDSAQQIIAEIGPKAAAFPSAAQLASWVGVCPGRQESAGVSSSDRSAKGNRSMRRLLNQLAHAAARKEDCQLQIVFRRLSSRLGYAKAVWAIAHRLCRLIWKVLHAGVSYVEYGPAPTPIALKRRRQRLVTQLKKLGYQVQLIPVVSDASSV
jgi:transposase